MSNLSRISVLSCFIILVTFVISHSENDETCNKNKENKYSKLQNIIFANIDEAIANYEPCSPSNCTCHSKRIKIDLAPFQAGITKTMLNSIRDRGTKYQIIDHKLWRQKDCLFPSRCSGIEHFIKEHLHRLPNMELVINCRDWPQIHQNWQLFGPVLSFSKTNDYLDIMYPAWSFWEGGPAISLYPTGLGRWDLHRKSLTRAANAVPWTAKISRTFFRGSRTSDERDNLILLSRQHPDLIDAQYTKNQAWKSPQDTLNADPAKEVSLEDHCKYKFLFNYRGVAASFRFKHLFLCQSLVFHVGNEWHEFFYDSMKPWIHYVPVPADASIDYLKDLVEFFRQHDEIAERVARQGFEHILNNLRMTDVSCYWRKLLKKYAKLLKFDVELDPNLIMV